MRKFRYRGLKNLLEVAQQRLEPGNVPSAPMLLTSKLSYFCFLICNTRAKIATSVM